LLEIGPLSCYHAKQREEYVKNTITGLVFYAIITLLPPTLAAQPATINKNSNNNFYQSVTEKYIVAVYVAQSQTQAENKVKPWAGLNLAIVPGDYFSGLKPGKFYLADSFYDSPNKVKVRMDSLKK
jgi:hypothetical protein